MTDFWTDKRVLVTGGAGYLAFSLMHLLKDRARSIIRLGRPGCSFPPISGTASIENIEADIRDPSVWDRLLKNVDVIFHLAAQTSAARADANPDEDAAVNVAPVAALIQACRQKQVAPIVIFAGTATECGVTETFPVDETVPDHPVTAYDRHKLEAERKLEEANKNGILKAVTLRLPNLYGPGPRGSSADRGILNLMVQRALAGDALTVYGAGAYMRDYLFVEDAARAFLAAAEYIESTKGSHFLIGSECGHTIKEAFELVAECVAARDHAQVEVRRVEPDAPLHMIEIRNFVADAEQFRKLTGWRASIDLITGVNRTIAFYEGSA